MKVRPPEKIKLLVIKSNCVVIRRFIKGKVSKTEII